MRRKNGGKGSFIKKTAVIIGGQLLGLIIMLAAFILYSYQTAKENMETSVQNLIQIYGHELQNKLDNADKVLERLVYNNSDYEMLQSEKESDRYFAAVALGKHIEESIAFDSHVDAVVIAESRYATCLDRQNTSIVYTHRSALRSFTMKAAELGTTRPYWIADCIDATPYVYRMYVWQGKAAALYISVDSFMDIAADSDFESLTVFLTDNDNTVWGCYGYKSGLQPVGEEMVPVRGIRNEYALGNGELSLVLNISVSEIMGQIKMNMVGLAVIIMLSLLTTTFLFRVFRKEISAPMADMGKCMEEIQRGNYDLRIDKEYGSTEFTMFKDTFNKLMDEIMGLKIASYEKQIELHETELKCVKLQIRPHFFLNAMTTISSLSMQGKNKEIQTYIDALSKNIRYMFQSGLHTVSLGEEIRHVENYFEMQELKYPGSVFYFIEMEEGLSDWRIPQMLIHTIIENEYKYAVSVDTMLTILIKAKRVTYANEEMLYLSIEDDGKGYPEEVIAELESGREGANNGLRVGLWSVKRMLELMYERTDLFKISNIKPHGGKNRFYIPQRPLHEVQNEAVANRLD